MVKNKLGVGVWLNDPRVGSYSDNKEKKNGGKNSISVSLPAYNFHSLAFSIESQ